MLHCIGFMVVIFLSTSGLSAQSDGHYSIVAPAVIRPHSEYHVAVSVEESTTPCEMRLGIEGSNNRYKNFHDITVPPYTSQLVRFVTGYMEPGGYKLSAEGLTGLVFHNEKQLSLVMKNASIFVQSDKAIYKPGDTVKFRILILDINLKPMPASELINIFILDGAKNRIKEWRNVQSYRGVVNEEFDLSDSPVLGEWNIITNIMGEEKRYKFEVAEYVLPKYEVLIDTPKHQYYKQGKVRASVRTKYTYGKPVKGELTVSVYPKTYGSFQPFALNLIARKAMKIDGKSNVEFDISDELHFKEDYEQAVIMEAIVEEELTGRKQNTTYDFYLHKSKYKIQLSDAASNYKPGLPYSLLVSVQTFDGLPVQSGSNEIRVLQSSSYYDDKNASESIHELDSNGILRYSFVVSHSKGFTLKFVYMDAEEKLGWISADQSKSQAFIRAELRTLKYEGRYTIHKRVPDTITSWVITGFSLDPVTGLGLIKQPTTLQVFQPFFVSLNLPYAVKRDEIVSISATVFNYLSDNLNAEVTLHNTDQDFEFVKMENEIDTPKIELYRRKTIVVKSNEGSAISFMVRPKRVGLVNIKVTARSSQAGDGIERLLKVEPEGEPQFENMAILIDLRDKSKFDGNFSISIPKNAVADSTKIEISATGDLLGGTVKNVEKLIRKPHGCGEQNMLNFVPNIVILDYLQSTNQLTPAVESKAKQYMELGYQRQLGFKHDDGSYSAFGKTDKTGSTWLTAFAVRSFLQAERHIQIDQKIVIDALDWLRDIQAANGSFPEVGNIISVDMQGESGKGIALTAFVLTAFLEDRSKLNQYKNVINKAVDYVVRNLEGNDDLYALAISSYALQMANHNAKNYILQTFDTRAIRKDGKQWWQKPIPPQDSKNIWYSKPNSISVEMTSYGLLALLEAGLYSEALPILKWLLDQRNELGGFQSTQDTFVGLKAISKYAERSSTNSNSMQISLNYIEGSDTRINVNSNNALIQQTYELPNSVRLVNVTASGRGLALLQLAFKYNLNVTGAWPRFTLDPQPNKNSHQDYLHLTVCTSFVPVGNVTRSNMAVMEVEFPSGFTADLDTLPSLEISENVKKVETTAANTKVIVYFDHLSRKELCPTLDAFRTQKVANQRPAVVTLYDYYDNTRRSRQFYRMREITLCDICEAADCSDTCQVRASGQRSPKSAFVNGEDELRAFASSSAHSSSTVTVICFFIFIIFN